MKGVNIMNNKIENDLRWALVKLFVMAYRCDRLKKYSSYGDAVLRVDLRGEEDRWSCIYIEYIDRGIRNIAKLDFRGEPTLVSGTAEAIIEFSESISAR